MTDNQDAPFQRGELVGPINGSGNGQVVDYHQGPDGRWVVGVGGSGNQLRYFLAVDMERKDSWGLPLGN